MAKKYTDVKISLDLLSASRRYLAFAQRNLPNLNLRREDLIKAALYRYEYFWLPLGAKHRDKALEAPPDIFWVWHCHMLSPVVYGRDCDKLIGGPIGCESFMRTEAEIKAHLKESEELWKKEYGSTHSFYIDMDAPADPDDTNKDINLDPHVLANALRQIEFGYQVNMPHYDDPGYLSSSVLRYRKFLYLNLVRPDLWVLPTFDIDFVWHAHQLCPLQYREDIMRLLGREYNHGDVPPGLPKDTKLHYPDMVTRAAWVEEFGDALSIYGAGYRGINPIGKMNNMDTDGLALLAPRSVRLVVSKVTVVTVYALTKDAKLKLKTPLGSDVVSLYLQSPKDENKKSRFLRRKKREGGFCFDTSKDSRCIAELSVKDKVTPWASKNGNGTGSGVIQLDLTAFVAKLNRHQSAPFHTTVKLDDVTKMELELLAKPITLGQLHFSIQPGTRSKCVTSGKLTDFWGPFPLPEGPLAGKEGMTNIVTFNIVDSNKKDAFVCRLLDCPALEQDGTQIFFNGEMVVISHPIGGIHLPHPSHITHRNATPTLNPIKGEKAFIIKNNAGDWGIMIGHLKKEKKLDVSLREEEKEYLHLSMWILEARRKMEIKLPNENEEHEFTLEGVHINLTTNSVTVDTPESPVAECLAMAFTLKLLWRACKESWKDNVEKMPIHRLKSLGKGVILANRVNAATNLWT